MAMLNAFLELNTLSGGGVGSGCTGPFCGRRPGFGTFKPKVGPRPAGLTRQAPTKPAVRKSAAPPAKAAKPEAPAQRKDRAPAQDLERQARAKESQRVAGQAEQALADKTEEELSRGLGVPRTSDNRPFDLQSGKVGIEVKTLINQTNDKITMSKDALARKQAALQETGVKGYTVVCDKRSTSKATAYYYREGFGSFRIGSMTKVDDLAGLKKALKLK